jgi:cytochrome P450
MANDADHTRQRRALSHAFSTKALLEQEYIVKNYVDIFSQKMQEFAKGDGIVDVTDWFAYTTFDVIGDMALGEPFGCLTSGSYLPPASSQNLTFNRGLPLLGPSD